MSQKILVPVLNDQQKSDLFDKIDDDLAFLPELPAHYRFVLRISNDVYEVFHLDLQIRKFFVWKRVRRFDVSLQNLKDRVSVNDCLIEFANDLIMQEATALQKMNDARIVVNWVVE